MSDIVWEQMGQNINGDNTGDYFGNSVALSGDGTIMAVGATGSDSNGTDSGLVRVYQYTENSDTWAKLGQDLQGEGNGKESGNSVSLSNDGTILAIGAIKDADTANALGRVRIYQYSSGNWSQLGSDLTFSRNSKFYVSLSSNGQSLAVGMPVDWLSSQEGNVQYWVYDGNDWTEQAKRVGATAADRFGSSIALSSDGLRLVVGGPLHDANGTSSGMVKVFNYDAGHATNKLQPVGQIIYGQNAEDVKGVSVAISGNGSIIALGATGYDGSGSTDNGVVQVYQYVNEHDLWVQLGQDLEGESSYDESGISISLSDNGLIIAIGAWKNDSSGDDSGHVKIYEYSNDSWVQVGNNINGSTDGDNFGKSVALSNSGSILAVGSPENIGKGLARTFILPIRTEETIKNSLSDEPVTIETGKYLVSSSDIISTLGDIYNNLNTDGVRTQRRKVARSILKKYKSLLNSGEAVFTEPSALNLTDATLSSLSRFKILNASSSLNSSDSIPLVSSATISELGDGEGFYTILENTGDNIRLIGEDAQFIEITKREDGDYDVNKNNIETVIMSEGESLDLYGIYFVLGSVSVGEGTTSSSSNICFVASTPVQTDQGREQISKLIPGYHTINGKQIKAITETVTKDKFIYKIKRNAFEKNKPSKETIVSGNHLIEFEGILVPTRSLEGHPNIELVRYNGERLYNILMDKHEVITINNMKVETLHPNNLIAKLFTNESFKNMDKKEKNEFIKKFNKKVGEMNLIKYQ